MQGKAEVTVEIPRDRWGRPMIWLPDKSARVPYQRASSIGKKLDDTTNIIRWKNRLVAQGIANNTHLRLKVAAAGDNRSELNAICEEAFESAGGSVKAEIGTALHALTEKLDKGETNCFVPDEYADDLYAYQVAVEPFEWLAIEQFLVNDEIQVAGTPDRIAELRESLAFENGVVLPAGWRGIVDLKTGSVDFPHGFSAQLGTYAHSEFYDAESGKRSPLPPGVDDKWGVLIHLPAGEGRAELYLLDIEAGYKAAFLALEVDRWRKQKGLTSPMKENA